jgi:hypothetical protein
MLFFFSLILRFPQAVHQLSTLMARRGDDEKPQKRQTTRANKILSMQKTSPLKF